MMKSSSARGAKGLRLRLPKALNPSGVEARSRCHSCRGGRIGELLSEVSVINPSGFFRLRI